MRSAAKPPKSDLDIDRARLSPEAMTLLRALKIACPGCGDPVVIFDGGDRCDACRPLPPKRPKERAESPPATPYTTRRPRNR